MGTPQQPHRRKRPIKPGTYPAGRGRRTSEQATRYTKDSSSSPEGGAARSKHLGYPGNSLEYRELKMKIPKRWQEDGFKTKGKDPQDPEFMHYESYKISPMTLPAKARKPGKTYYNEVTIVDDKSDRFKPGERYYVTRQKEGNVWPKMERRYFRTLTKARVHAKATMEGSP